MTPLTLIMLVGAPGCGKSTYAESLLAMSTTDMAILSPDALRKEMTGDVSNHSKDGWIFSHLIPIRLNGLHSRRFNVVFDATSYCRRNRKDIIKHAKWLGYEVEAHVFRVPIDVCKARNAARARVVPSSVIEKQFAQWQEPTLEEGFTRIVEVPYSPAS